MTFDQIMAVYSASNGDATKAMYAEIESLGSAGHIAVNLLRAAKTSSRAKLYRGKYRGAGYDTKQWAMNNICRKLVAEGDQLGMVWGWGRDPKAIGFEHVLYLDLPTGQVSFHTSHRGEGPDYPSQWDGERDQAPTRIINWTVSLFQSLLQGATNDHRLST